MQQPHFSPFSAFLSPCFSLCVLFSLFYTWFTAYDTTIPTMLRDRSIGSWHIGHAIDAAASPSSHPTHTARWLHGTYSTPRSSSMHTTQRWLSSVALMLAWWAWWVTSWRSSWSSCLTWRKVACWWTRCWRKVGEERAVEALYALQAILQERRERECAARGADAAAAPEPCGAVRMPSAADRAVGRALVWVAKRVGGYYDESSLCRRF